LTYIRHWRSRLGKVIEAETKVKVVQLARIDRSYAITVAELKSVSKALDGLLTDSEVAALTDYLAHNPESGQIIPGTNGIRKIRWQVGGKGKSKGMRIVYYYHDLNMPLYMLAVYTKGEKLRLSKREEIEMSKLVERLKLQHSKKWEESIRETNRAVSA
jgi:hypothetical protein